MEDGDLLDRLLKLCEKISFVKGVLVRLMVVLVSVFGTCGGVMLEVDCKFRDPKALVAAN